MTYQEIVHKHARANRFSLGHMLSVMHILNSDRIPYVEKMRQVESGEMGGGEVRAYEAIMKELSAKQVLC